MVGVPRSKGCRICVQRRVKCDQTKPTCNNCKKGNRPCPGYGQELKFQDEGARLRKRFEGEDAMDFNTTTSEATNANSQAGASNQSRKPPTIPGQTQEWDVVGLPVAQTNRRAFLGLLEGRASDYAHLRNTLPTDGDFSFAFDASDREQAQHIDRFLFKNFGRSINPFYEAIADNHATQNALIQNFQESLFPEQQIQSLPKAMRNHANWLAHLPPLTGTNALLDSAVRAVTLVHIGTLNASEPFIMESRPYYGSALRLLNKALQSKTSGMSNETLCSVILLSFYEMFASDNNDSWVRHAGGVSALMRARGPARHAHGFDREIFLAYRYTLIIEAFQEDVPCFLAEPGWVKLSRDIHADLAHSGLRSIRLDIFNMAEEYYQSMVVLPGICAQARANWHAKQNGQDLPYDRAILLEKMVIARANFRSTFQKFESALKRAGHAPTINLNAHDPLISIEYEFVNTFVSSTYVGYWTVLIVLNLCLQGLQSTDPEIVQSYQTESKECSLNICRASAYMLTSTFLGPFFLIFGLRVGLIVFEDIAGAGQPDKEADWILRKLFEIGEKHMGIAKHIPGYIAGMSSDELIRKFRARKTEVQQAKDEAQISEFGREIANGAVPVSNITDPPQVTMVTDEIGGVTPSRRRTPQLLNQADAENDWKSMTPGDISAAWDDQDIFQLQSSMDNLGVPQDHSRSSTSSPRPATYNEQQQFSRAAAAFAMPDMSFFDPMLGMDDLQSPQQQTTNTFTSPGMAAMSQPSPASYYQPEGEPSLEEMQEAMEAIRGQSASASSPSDQSTPSHPKRQNTLPRGLERFFS